MPRVRWLWLVVPPVLLGAFGLVSASGRLRTLAWLAILISAAYIAGLLWRRFRLTRANLADYETGRRISQDLEQYGRAAPGKDREGSGGDALRAGLHSLHDLRLIDLDPRVTAQFGNGVDGWMNHRAARELAVARRAGPLGYGTIVALFEEEPGTDLVRVVAPPTWWTAGYVSGAATELAAPLVPGSHSYAAFVNQSRKAAAETPSATAEVGRRLKDMLNVSRERRPLIHVTGAWIGPGVLLAGRVEITRSSPEGEATAPVEAVTEAFAVFPFALLDLMADTAARHRPVFREVALYGIAKTQLKVLRRPRVRPGDCL